MSDLKMTLETGGYVELHGIDSEALLLTPEEARDLRNQLNALELGDLPSGGWCTNCDCDGCYTARRASK